MLNSKIAIKLSLSFAIALIFFSIIIGGVFVLLFRNHTLEIHKNELEKRAHTISDTISSFMDKNSGVGEKVGGYAIYLSFIADIAGTDVWIIDSDYNVITGGAGQDSVGGRYYYNKLPTNAGQIISEVFNDKTVFSKDFSSVFPELTLTVGAPIKDKQGQVIGAVLLHTPVNGVYSAVAQGMLILGISIAGALLISVIISVAFSYSFTKPLSKMKNNAIRLARGEYTAKNNIIQQDEIGELADTLDILADRLYVASRESEKLEKMRRDFVANVSHELKTPVTVLRGSLEALVDKVVTDDNKIEEYYKQMLLEAEFLQRLVGDLLDLARLQNTDFVIEKSEICICDVLDDATRSAFPLAQKKNVKIDAHKKPNTLKMYGDYGRIRQMLMIVIDNAIKFSPDNGVVEILLSDNQLSVKDYGVGIEEDHLPYIFDRFYKSCNEHNKTGTGLGLSIAKQIADRHDINLSVESVPGQGAEFIFKF